MWFHNFKRTHGLNAEDFIISKDVLNADGFIISKGPMTWMTLFGHDDKDCFNPFSVCDNHTLMELWLNVRATLASTSLIALSKPCTLSRCRIYYHYYYVHIHYHHMTFRVRITICLKNSVTAIFPKVSTTTMINKENPAHSSIPSKRIEWKAGLEVEDTFRRQTLCIRSQLARE